MVVSILLGGVIVLLLFCSAFVSASELAFFSLKPADIQTLQTSDKPVDVLILKLRQDPDRLLSTVLIANNLVNVAIVILSSLLVSRLFQFAGKFWLSFLVNTVLITFFLLLFGENLPKLYAERNVLSFSRRAARALSVLQTLLYPISWLLVRPVARVKRRESHGGAAITMDDLSQAFELTSDEIKEDKEILEGIIRFGDINVSSAMTSRLDMVAVPDDMSYSDLIQKINDTGYSRLPVYHETLDNIVGILYIKDLLAHLDVKKFSWQSLVRKACFVPLTKHINVLLQEFQKNKIHIAVVVDEFGGTAGIITMEDIMEEIVGEIDDEFDDSQHLYVRLGADSYLCEGKIQLNDFYRLEGVEAEDFAAVEGEAETLAGLVLEMRGEIPAQETEFDYMHYRFKIVSSDKRRIKTVKLSLLPMMQQDSEDASKD